jgi:hypothetical protein
MDRLAKICRVHVRQFAQTEKMWQQIFPYNVINASTKIITFEKVILHFPPDSAYQETSLHVRFGLHEKKKTLN